MVKIKVQQFTLEFSCSKSIPTILESKCRTSRHQNSQFSLAVASLLSSSKGFTVCHENVTSFRQCEHEATTLGHVTKSFWHLSSTQRPFQTFQARYPDVSIETSCQTVFCSAVLRKNCSFCHGMQNHSFENLLHYQKKSLIFFQCSAVS